MLLTTFLPNIYSVALSGKSFNNANPRSQRDNVAKDQSLDSLTKQRIVRAKNASDNGFENIGYFAAAVAAANHAGVPNEALNTLSIGYVAARNAYNLAYIFLQDNEQLSWVRSAVYFTGVGLVTSLWLKAANLSFDKVSLVV